MSGQSPFIRPIGERAIEFRFDHLEVRAGVGRLVWGRLDEVMPSDRTSESMAISLVFLAW
jgi:hypothetical protein